MDLYYLLRAIAALLITIGLLLGIAWLVKKYGLFDGSNFLQKNETKRLRIIEQLWLDNGRSRLMIIECDKVEHIIMVSANGAQNLGIATQKIKENENVKI